MNDLERQKELLDRELDHRNRALKELTEELEKKNSSKAFNNENIDMNPAEYNSCFEENLKLSGAKVALEGEIFKLEQKVIDFQNHNQMLKNDMMRLEGENANKNKEVEEWKNKMFEIEKKQMRELEDLKREMENYKRQNSVIFLLFNFF